MLAAAAIEALNIMEENPGEFLASSCRTESLTLDICMKVPFILMTSKWFVFILQTFSLY